MPKSRLRKKRKSIKHQLITHSGLYKDKYGRPVRNLRTKSVLLPEARAKDGRVIRPKMTWDKPITNEITHYQ